MNLLSQEMLAAIRRLPDVKRARERIGHLVVATKKIRSRHPSWPGRLKYHIIINLRKMESKHEHERPMVLIRRSFVRRFLRRLLGVYWGREYHPNTWCGYFCLGNLGPLYVEVMEAGDFDHAVALVLIVLKYTTSHFL